MFTPTDSRIKDAEEHLAAARLDLHFHLYNISVQGGAMSSKVSYSYARQHFAEILTEAADSQEPVIVSRRGYDDVAIIPAAELRSLEETAHLLRSPVNARRLLAALHRALSETARPTAIAELRAELDLA
jgi:antitoxin YefM